MTWAAAAASPVRSVGLCYGVTYTVAQLAGYLGLGPWVEHPHTPELWARLMYADVPAGVEYSYGGINHMTWILSLTHQGRDMYPRIRELPDDPRVLAADGVRCEILKSFGYWSTENHWHFTDYVPYFRKTEAMIDRFLPRRWNLLALETQVHAASAEEIDRQLRGEIPVQVQPNMLAAPGIINAMVTGEAVRVSGNMRNQGLIPNLPPECVVEVPIDVDRAGLHPVAVGPLPTQCAALNRTNINVQELMVQAALTADRQAALHALMLDPLTAAVCTLEQIRDMFRELFEAQRKWLCTF